MAKFCKQFRKVQNLKFESYYFNYKKLKQQITHFLENHSGEQSNLTSTLNYPSFFILFFEEELSKVIQRFNQETANLKLNLNKLLSKQRELR